METTSATTRRGGLIAAVSGLSLFMVTVTMYALETSFNPFFYIVGQSRRVAHIAAYFYLLAVLGYWSAVFPVLLEQTRQIPVVLASFIGGFVLVAIGSGLAQRQFDETILFEVGRHAWWLGAGLALISVRPGMRLLSRRTTTTRWRTWAGVGGVAFATGMLIYALSGRAYSPSVMLAKVVLILLVPTVSLLAIAIRSDKGWGIRLVSAAAALAAVAEAAIH
jgi:hypothetical protein